MTRWTTIEESRRMMEILTFKDILIVNDILREFFDACSFASEFDGDEDFLLRVLWIEFIEPNKEFIKLQGVPELYKWFREELYL